MKLLKSKEVAQMREILFKAKRLDNGEWVVGDLSQHKSGKKFIKAGSATQSFEVSADTICQYTGLTDKNCNKIWENDIVKVKFREGRIGAVEKEYNYVAVYDEFQAYWRFEGNDDLLGSPSLVQSNQHIFEVIGNIFDNPELLEGGAE
jgi:uncharacterized phage protein (TIGR01671 family)